METAIEKLLGLAGEPLGGTLPILPTSLLETAGILADELIELLNRKNGFYAFESALHILPAQSCGLEIGLIEWNSEQLWIHEYQGMAKEFLFFAEDIFGVQFCLKADGVYQFDPETGHVDKLAHNFEGWADAILRNYRLLTGHPLAHEWQQLNGKIASGVRLVPKQLFVLGGAFSIQNLYALDAVSAMRMRASIAVQIKELPDGTKIRLKVVD
jgi:hypothetical protein